MSETDHLSQAERLIAECKKGVCEGLAELEAATAAAPSKKPGADGKAGKVVESPPETSESAVVAEWLASPQIRAWAQIKPPLAGTDLRPYLFVTKDRKDYFGAASALGHLAGVVDKLFGPKLAVLGSTAISRSWRRRKPPRSSKPCARGSWGKALSQASRRASLE